MISKLFGFLSSNKRRIAQDHGDNGLHVAGDRVFLIQAPEDWIREQNEETFGVSSPDGAVAFTASAYSVQEGTIEEFAKLRWDAVDGFYEPQSAVRPFSTGIGKGFLREYEGVWPGEASPTYSVPGCLDLGGVFVSFSFTTTRHDFQANLQRYMQMLSSMRKCT